MAMGDAIEIRTTDNLTTLQKRDAETLASRLNVSFQANSAIKSAKIAFRPAIPPFSDQLIYYPEGQHLLAYWSVFPEDPISGALRALSTHLPALKLSADPLGQAIDSLSANGKNVSSRPVMAYWSAPFQGGPYWFIRRQALPQWYDDLATDALASFLNQHAPLPESLIVQLTYQAFNPDYHPNNGLLHYFPEQASLIINVPLSLDDLPRVLQPAANQRFALSAMLLSFLYLQRDPKIPGLDFDGWRAGLEEAFREEGFWEG